VLFRSLTFTTTSIRDDLIKLIISSFILQPTKSLITWLVYFLFKFICIFSSFFFVFNFVLSHLLAIKNNKPKKKQQQTKECVERGLSKVILIYYRTVCIYKTTSLTSFLNNKSINYFLMIIFCLVWAYKYNRNFLMLETKIIKFIFK
jgi:hypothetical protein